MSGNFHKFDVKGNLIKESVNILKDVKTTTRYTVGIETDRAYLWILYTEGTGFKLTRYNKNWNAITTFTPAITPGGITTNGKEMLISQSGGNIVFYTKALLNVRSGTTSIAYLTMSFDGEHVLALKNDFKTIETLDHRTLAIVNSFTIGTGTYGVCWVGNKIALINNNNLEYYTRSGVLISSTALTDPSANRRYVDLCFDKEFLWMTSNVGELGPP